MLQDKMFWSFRFEIF